MKFSKPIISKYVNFNSRDIIYQNIFGKRYVRRVYRDYGIPFPIPTTNLLTDEEFKNILMYGLTKNHINSLSTKMHCGELDGKDCIELLEGIV